VPAKTVTLVRHGQTERSLRKAYSGRLDIPLTDEGRAQACATAARLARDATVDAIFSSPLVRARDTAQAIADATGAPLTVDERLTEIDYAPFEGLDRAEALARFGQAFEDWRDDPFGAPVDGMETLEEALQRARPATADALAAGEHPVIVAHQGILRIVLVALGELEPADYFTRHLREAEPVVVVEPRVR
jgi:broad specificity phosphatase PhoE